MKQSGHVHHTSSSQRKTRQTPQVVVIAVILILAMVVVVLGVGRALSANDPADSTSGTQTSDGTADPSVRPAMSAETDPAESTGTSIETAETTAQTSTVTTTNVATPIVTGDVQPTTATLVAVGDIILHQAVIDGGLTGDSTDQYDYDPVFQYVEPILAKADYAMANYEGTLSGPPYSGYPYFRAPDAIADALQSAGFKAIVTANNHTLDRGLDGVVRTAQTFLDRGMPTIGTRPDETRRSDAVVDIQGIKVGLLAFTFETLQKDGLKTLNGNTMPKAADPLIDSFNPYESTAFEQDLQAIIDRQQKLRDEGAELICLTLHWGEEYRTTPVAYQRNMAQRLADAGVELIIGHHPHVLEEIAVVHSKVTGKDTLVFYSIGNFLHNMDYDTHDTAGKAQDAVIARVTITRDTQGVRVTQGEYIPTHVIRFNESGRLRHRIVPVWPALQNPAAYGTTVEEMTAARDRILAILGTSQGSEDITVICQAE